MSSDNSGGTLKPSTPALETPVELDISSRPRGLSVGKGNTWGFANLQQENNTAATGRPSDVIPAPQSITPQHVNSNQPNPPPRIVHAIGSRPASPQPQAPQQLVRQNDTTHGSTSQQADSQAPNYATPPPANSPVKQRQISDPEISPESMNESLMDWPTRERTPLPPRKRPGGIINDGPSKRHQNSSIRSTQADTAQDFISSKNSLGNKHHCNDSIQSVSGLRSRPQHHLDKSPQTSHLRNSLSHRNQNMRTPNSNQNFKIDDIYPRKQVSPQASSMTLERFTLRETELLRKARSVARAARGMYSTRQLSAFGPSRLNPFGSQNHNGKLGLHNSSGKNYRRAPMATPDLMEIDIDQYSDSEHEKQPSNISIKKEQFYTSPINGFDCSEFAAPRQLELSGEDSMFGSFEGQFSDFAANELPVFAPDRADLAGDFVSQGSKKRAVNQEKMHKFLRGEMPPGTHSKSRLRSRSAIDEEIQHKTSRLQAPHPEAPNDRATANPVLATPQPARGNSVVPWDDDEADSTPLVDIFNKQRLAKAVARKSSSNPYHMHPVDHIKAEYSIAQSSKLFSDFKRYERSTPSKPYAKSRNAVPSITRGHSRISGYGNKRAHSPAHQEVIDLTFTPESASIIRSVPIRDRIAPARKSASQKEKQNSKTPRRALSQMPTVDLTAPEIRRKQKAKDFFVQEDPEVLRQKQAAAQIIHKEVDVNRVELDEALFGEADAESEEAKAKKTAADAKKAEEYEARMLARLMKEEIAHRTDLEKRRRQAEEELERKQREAEEQEFKRLRREVERKRSEQAHQIALEEKRENAIARIKADREAAEKERQKNIASEKAAGIQAQAEELAKLKLKQELAKKQALSLLAKKVQSVDKEIAPSVPAENNHVEDIISQENEDEEDNLFVFDNTKLDKTTASQSSEVVSAARSIYQSSNQATLAQLRHETQAQRGENARTAKARLDGRLKSHVELQNPIKQVIPTPPPQERFKPVKLSKKVSATKAAPVTMQEPDSEEEEFAWSNKRTTIPEAAADCAPACETVQDQVHGSNLDENTVFVWSPIGSPEPELVPSTSQPNVTQDTLSQTSGSLPPHITEDPSSISLSLTQDNNPKSSSPIFQANLRKLSQQKLERNQVQESAKTKEAVARGRSEQQKADRRRKEAEKTAEKAAERKRLQIIADAEKKGIGITPDALKAQVDVFMAKRLEDLQRRSEKRAQKLAGGSQVFKELKAQPEKPPCVVDPLEKPRGNNEVTDEQLIRKDIVLIRKERQSAIALERGNLGYLAAASKTTVADFETDSESDEDEDDDPDGLVAALLNAFNEDNDKENDDDDSDHSEFESESKSNVDSPEIGSAPKSIIHNQRVVESQPCLATPVITSNLTLNNSSICSPLKRSSLLPKNILDAPPFNPAKMSSPDKPREIVLVNIYRVLQVRNKGNDADEPRLVDNYGLNAEAENRIHTEVEKFRKSGIQMSSSSTHYEAGKMKTKITHSANGNVWTEFYVDVQTRMADTLSGYDPELFTPVVGKKIWNVVQSVLPKVTSPAYAAPNSNTIENTDTTEDNNTARDSNNNSTDDENTSEEEEHDDGLEEDRIELAESQHQHVSQAIFTIISSNTVLEMANNSACEVLIKFIKPRGCKIDEIERYTDGARQLREMRDSCNEAGGVFNAYVENDEVLMPWVDWARVDVQVVEQALVGPLN